MQLCAMVCPAELGSHHDVIIPTWARLSMLAQLGHVWPLATALPGCGTGSQLCTRPVQACSARLCLHEPCRFSAGAPNPSPGDPPAPGPGTSSFCAPTWHHGVDVPAACHPCSLPEEKGVDLGQRSGAYFYSCCHH